MTGTPSESELERAESELSLANSRLEDAERSYERAKDGPAAGDLSAAQLRVQIAQANLAQSAVSAPINGVITRIFTPVGDTVQPGVAAVEIEDQTPMYVSAQVSEFDVNRIQLGQAAEITLDAVYGATYHGKIVEIGASGEMGQGVVSFTVKVELTDRDEKVKSGMTAVVRIQAETAANVLLVPNRAVRLLEGRRVVYVEKGFPMPQPVPVTLGLSSDTMSQLLEGDLKEGDLVVTNPDIIPQQGQQSGPVR
jgi:HlyD family secretion protein